MRTVAAILMLLACLVYGAMPALSAMPVSTMTAGASVLSGHPHPHAAPSLHGTVAADPAAGDPCPHRHGLAHTAYCANCLVLPAPFGPNPAANGARSYPARGQDAPLTAAVVAPLSPPPRPAFPVVF